MLLSALLMPMRWQKRCMAAGVYPRRRIPAIVGIRGSDHPSTCLPSTSWISFRLESTVYCRFSRENSVCSGRLVTEVGKRPRSAASCTNQSSARWSSNSSVQRECVMPSSASEMQWAKSYMGIFHLSPVITCCALRMRYMAGSRMLMLGAAMSILARRTWAPSSYSPPFILRSISRFSSTDLSRNGEFVPGFVRVPRNSRISSADKLSTYALPFLTRCSATAMSSKYPDAS
eukprot:26791_3